MVHGPDPTVHVERAVMTMHWDTLTFLHWPYDPDAVQRLLPPGVTVQTYEGRAWMSLVPFAMRVTLPGVPVAPWLGHFPETNVRTYVTGVDGTEGIWFFSLDAARLAAVVAARAAYRLPYMWSKMTIARVGDVVTYQCRRRWPGPRGASSEIAIRVGSPYANGELDELDHWLSARWHLYSAMFGRVWAAKAEHERWPLQRAEVLHLDDRLVTAAGLPSPAGQPITQFAETVGVRVSIPAPVRASRAT